MPAPEEAIDEVDAQLSGPIGIEDRSPDGWDWRYYYKSTTPLTEKQSELVLKVGSLSSKLRELGRNDISADIMTRLKDLVVASLVQSFGGEVQPIIDEVNGLEIEFFRRVVKRQHQLRVIQPAFLTVVAILLLVAAYFVFGYKAVADAISAQLDANTLQTFLLVIVGCLVWRLIYYGMTYTEAINSIEQYFSLEREVSSPIVAIMFDVVAGFVACIFFITGMIVVAFGGEEGADGVVNVAVSTLQMAEKPLLAIGFGVLVGIVKNDFLRKVQGIARDGFS